MKNKEVFAKGEADKWFQRNKAQLKKDEFDKPTLLLCDWLQPFKSQIRSVLEIGCGSGHRLSSISNGLSAQGFGVEPSGDAISYIRKNFPSLTVKAGFGDSVPFDNKFDLVHLGFFLYLVDREDFLKCISEADRLLEFGGYLSIIDFETPAPYSNDYAHREGAYSYKQNNSNVFVASGLYTVINKFQFSHSHFHFDTNIDERISLTLLYKETSLFRGGN